MLSLYTIISPLLSLFHLPPVALYTAVTARCHISEHLDVERLDVLDQKVVGIGPKVILDEFPEVGIHVQQHFILAPLWPLGEELRGALVWVQSVDEGEVVGAEGSGTVIYRCISM